MPEYAKVERWNRWSGPFSDIVQTARDAIVTIEGWHDGADRDAVGDPLRVNTEIDLVDREIQSTFSSVDELAAIDDRDLATIRSIRVRAGWIGAVGRVTIDVSRSSPAVTTSVLGEDRDRVMGLHGAMHDSLSRSKTWLPRFDRGWCYPVMSGVTIGAVLPWAAVFGTGKMTRASIALPTVAGVIVLSLAVLAFLTRELELLAPDERPRIRRFRALAWGFAIAVVAGIVTAVIVALVHR